MKGAGGASPRRGRGGRALSRWRPARRRRHDESGFTLIEAVVALSILAVSVIFLGATVASTGKGQQQTQARSVAVDLAQETLQQADNLGYATVAEGVDCPTGTGSSPCASDPNALYHYLGGSDGSGGCWYYGTTTRYVVPTQNETNGAQPIIPYTSTQTSSNVAYTITTYPMFDTTTYPSVSCSTLTNDSAPTVPLILVVIVGWGSGSQAQTVSLQTQMYSSEPLPPTAGQCPVATPQQGGHVESHLAYSTSGETPNFNYTPNAQGTDPGAQYSSTVNILFLDEAPTTYTPTFCVTLANGTTEPYSIPVNPACNQIVCQTDYGSSSSLPFIAPSDITAVHGSFRGSGPNAANPASVGYCKTAYPSTASGTNPPSSTGIPTTCDVEEVWTIETPPSSISGYAVECMTIAAWDHEGDFDSNTWSFNPAYTCQQN